jgi:hypothetical protein
MEASMRKVILYLVIILSGFLFIDHMTLAEDKQQGKKTTPTKTKKTQKESESQKGKFNSDVINYITFMAKLGWEVRISKVSPNELIAVLERDDFIAKSPEKEKSLWTFNRDSIIDYVGSNPFLGSEPFYYIKEPEKIFSFVQYKDKIYILIDAIGVGTIFNTLRVKPKERAKKIFDQYAVEALSGLSSKSLKGLEGAIIVIAYGSKNFLDKDEFLNLKAEAILVISSFDNIRRFKNGDIDDQEFTKNAIVFLSDRDRHDARRINLSSQ